ncbi:MAG: ATP-binding protein [Pseudomonadota bacterium]
MPANCTAATPDSLSERDRPTDSGHQAEPSWSELSARISSLMVFRAISITVVFGTTLGLNAASPERLARPSTIWLFAVVGITFLLTGVFAYVLPRVKHPLRWADLQIGTELIVTTILIHLTGGAQSGYSFFYLLSILGAALLRYRRGALVVALVSILLYVSVSVIGWLGWLPIPAEQRPLPWEMTAYALIRQNVLNAAAFAAVAVLSALLGQQLAHAGARLESQEARTADLAVLNQDIIRCLSSGLVTVDRRGTVLTFNEAAEDILGIPASHTLGRPLAAVFPQAGALVDGLDSDTIARRTELTAQHPINGRVTLGLSVSPLTDHLKNPIGRILNFQDLTELRRMEQEVARTQRLAVVGQLAAFMAHDLRNPLAAISGSIELLKAAPQVDEDQRTLMDIVLREVDRLNGLATDLLEYAKPREPVPLPVDIWEVLTETTRVFANDRSSSSMTVSLRRQPAAERSAPVIAHADPSQLRQIIWNLLKNATEAMPNGGEVVVTLDVLRDTGSFVEVSVADSGVGIREEDLEHVFDPFYTTKSGGTGLGLATVHRIVTSHGGTVAAISSPGKGTCIRVKLPL